MYTLRGVETEIKSDGCRNMCGYYLDAGVVCYIFRGKFGSYVLVDIYIKIVQNTRDRGLV